MNPIAIHELKSPRMFQQRLTKEGELVLTSNGKPVAIILHIPRGEDLEEILDSVRAARGQLALRRLRDAARKGRKDRMTPREIQEVIGKSRADRKPRG
jgi:hypothetical protein